VFHQDLKEKSKIKIEWKVICFMRRWQVNSRLTYRICLNSESKMVRFARAAEQLDPTATETIF
jgi:hypothetical protein